MTEKDWVPFLKMRESAVKSEMVMSPQSNLFTRGIYIPNDGERLSVARPGSWDALKVPSRVGQVRFFRDGRREEVV